MTRVKGIWTWEDAGEDASGAHCRGTSLSGAHTPQELWGKGEGLTPSMGSPQMGLAPLGWKPVLPLGTAASASTLQWEDGIWTLSSQVAKKLLRTCLVLCPPHAAAGERFSENSATQRPSHLSWTAREPSAHKLPSQP